MGRIAAWVFMYFVDLPLLWECELWTLDVKSAAKEIGWNPIIYELALHGRCYNERLQFMVFSSLGLCFFTYLAYNGQRFQQTLVEEIPYVLRVNKDAPKGMFFSQCKGERSMLLAGTV